jgi:hypothetical protein
VPLRDKASAPAAATRNRYRHSGGATGRDILAERTADQRDYAIPHLATQPLPSAAPTAAGSIPDPTVNGLMRSIVPPGQTYDGGQLDACTTDSPAVAEHNRPPLWD